jgi:hypothetical protein
VRLLLGCGRAGVEAEEEHIDLLLVGGGFAKVQAEGGPSAGDLAEKRTVHDGEGLWHRGFIGGVFDHIAVTLAEFAEEMAAWRG